MKDFEAEESAERIDRMNEDNARIADAYLAELDETQISESILKDHGFQWIETGDYLMDRWEHPICRLALWQFNDTDEWIVNAFDQAGIRPVGIRSVGQLRTLLRLFGVSKGEKT